MESNICVVEQQIIEVNRQKKYMRKYERESYDGIVHCAKWEKKCVLVFVPFRPQLLLTSMRSPLLRIKL